MTVEDTPDLRTPEAEEALQRARRGVAAGTALLAAGLVLMVGCGAVLILASLAPSGPVAPTAAPEAARATAPASDATAVALIRRASLQAPDVSYHGVQLLSALGDSPASTVLEVTHTDGVSVASAVDGGTAPAETTAVGTDTTSETPVPQVMPLLQANYELTVGTTEDVAGTPTTLVEAHRPTGGIAARYWIEPTSGVVLRRELYDVDGTLTAESAFLEFTIDGATSTTAPAAVATAAALDAPLGAAAIGESDVSALRQDGWQVPTSLGPGLVLLDVRASGTTPADRVLHLTYTDGLVSLSLFEQNGSLDEAALDAQDGWDVGLVDGRRVVQALGVPRRVAWSDGEHVYTLVTDSGGSTVTTAMDALPSAAGDGSMRDRVRRGFARVCGWL